jgi:hypothetical protein
MCPFVSPDGKRVALVMTADPGGEIKQVVVVDGKPSDPYDEVALPSVRFSYDSKRTMWAARVKNRWFVVVDGQAGRGFKAVGPALFGPSGAAVHHGVRGPLWSRAFVVTDGREQRVRFRYLTGLTFSPDGTLAYAGARKGLLGPSRMVIVAGGSESPSYDAAGNVVFSPDGKRSAYIAVSSKRCSVVLDGNEGKRYDDVSMGSLAFSPDSKHLAYLAKQDGKSFVVVDEIEGQRYEVVLGIARDRRLVFDSPRDFHYMVSLDNEIFMVKETIH